MSQGTIVDYTIKMIEPLLGEITADPFFYRKAVSKHLKRSNQKTVTENMDIKTIDCFRKIFLVNDEGHYIRSSVIKNFLLDAHESLKYTLSEKSNPYKVMDGIRHYVYVMPWQIHFGRQPDGSTELLMKHKKFKLVDYYDKDTELKFGVMIIDNPIVTHDLVSALFTRGELKGIGLRRRDGYGRFIVTRKSDKYEI